MIDLAHPNIQDFNRIEAPSRNAIVMPAVVLNEGDALPHYQYKENET